MEVIKNINIKDVVYGTKEYILLGTKILSIAKNIFSKNVILTPKFNCNYLNLSLEYSNEFEYMDRILDIYEKLEFGNFIYSLDSYLIPTYQNINNYDRGGNEREWIKSTLNKKIYEKHTGIDLDIPMDRYNPDYTIFERIKIGTHMITFNVAILKDSYYMLQIILENSLKTFKFKCDQSDDLLNGIKSIFSYLSGDYTKIDLGSIYDIKSISSDFVNGYEFKVKNYMVDDESYILSNIDDVTSFLMRNVESNRENVKILSDSNIILSDYLKKFN